MKQFIILTALFFSFYGSLAAQVRFGVKAGLSSYDLANDGILIPGDDHQISWNIKNAGYGHHFGVYTRLTLLGLYLEPSLLLNSNTVTYDIKTYGESGVFNTIKNEKYNTLDVPVLAGIKAGALRFQGGVVGHLFINSISDIVDIKGYEQRFEAATYGWQGGMGLDVWNLSLDLLYEGNFNKFGDHITIGGQPFSFSSRPSRLLLTLGYKF